MKHQTFSARIVKLLAVFIHRYNFHLTLKIQIQCTGCAWNGGGYVVCSTCAGGYYLKHDTKGCVANCNDIG